MGVSSSELVNWMMVTLQLPNYTKGLGWPYCDRGYLFLFCLFAVLEFELRAFTLSHSTSPVLWWVFSR
jgi:hypothetical protein